MVLFFDEHYVGVHFVVEVWVSASGHPGFRVEVDGFVTMAKRSETLVVEEAGVRCRCRAWGSGARGVWIAFCFDLLGRRGITLLFRFSEGSVAVLEPLNVVAHDGVGDVLCG